MIRTTLIAICFTAALAAPAFAAGVTAVQSVDRMVVTTSEDGVETVTFVPVERAIPGDELYYSITIKNDGDEAASNVAPTLAVPSEVTFIEGSATAEGVSTSFSADGGETFAPRGELKVSMDGTPREARAAEITHVRWTLAEGVPAGGEAKVSFRAVIK